MFPLERITVYIRTGLSGYSRMRKCNEEMLGGISNAMLVSYQRGSEMNEDLRNGKLLHLYP
jgi:hypothetical protein